MQLEKTNILLRSEAEQAGLDYAMESAQAPPVPVTNMGANALHVLKLATAFLRGKGGKGGKQWVQGTRAPVSPEQAALAAALDKAGAMLSPLSKGLVLSGAGTIAAAARSKGKGKVQPAAVHSLAALDDTLQRAFERERERDSNGQGQLWQVSLPCLDYLPVSTCFRSAFQAAGPLLQAAQAQCDLATAKRQAARLVGSMRRRMGEHHAPSVASEGDAIGDGVLSLWQWRGMYGPRIVNDTPAFVCWRAIVASISREDMLGESIELWRADDSGAASWDALSGSALPLPQLVGDGSRWERATRLRFERARAGRLARLARRFQSVTMAATGRRVQAADKVHRALVQLLHGASLDDAAAAVGFSASTGGHGARAGDRLTQAVKRLGFRLQRDMRDNDRKPVQRRAAFVPLPASIPAAWHDTPSGGVASEQAATAKRQAARVARVARAALLAKRQAARAARVARASAKRASVQRWQARRVARSGLWAGGLPVQPLPRRYGLGKLSTSRNRTWLKFGRGPSD